MSKSSNTSSIKLREEEEVQGVLFATAVPLQNVHQINYAASLPVATATPAGSGDEAAVPLIPPAAQQAATSSSSRASAVAGPLRTVDDIRREEKEVTGKNIRRGEQLGKILAQQERLQVERESDNTALKKTIVEQRTADVASQVGQYHNHLERNGIILPPPHMKGDDDEEYNNKPRDNNNVGSSSGGSYGKGYEVSEYKMGEYETKDYEISEYKSVYD